MLARLEAAVNEIKRFTGDASHELRRPVSLVRTTAELALRNRQIDPASRRAFEQIVAECGKASRLLKDLLTLARADPGNARLAFEPVDLVEVVKTVCQKARSLEEEHWHTLVECFDAGGSATMWGHYSSLQRVLWILLENAAKYTCAGNHQDHADSGWGKRNRDRGGQRNWHSGDGHAEHLWPLLSRRPREQGERRIDVQDRVSLVFRQASARGPSIGLIQRRSHASVPANAIVD